MRLFLKWVLILGGIIAILSGAFFFYSSFLVDYSLENLEFAVSATSQPVPEPSRAKGGTFGNVVKDLVVEEASREQMDFKSLALLELASRSLEEAAERAGYSRAKFYLNQVLLAKLSSRNRSRLLTAADTAYGFMKQITRQFYSLLRYARKQVSGGVQEADEEKESSGLNLLRQAEEKEKKWQLEQAAQYYRKYLSLYPERPDRPLVMISLAHILMKQEKIHIKIELQN